MVIGYYLGQQKIEETKNSFEYDNFINVTGDLPGFRYTKLNGESVSEIAGTMSTSKQGGKL